MTKYCLILLFEHILPGLNVSEHSMERFYQVKPEMEQDEHTNITISSSSFPNLPHHVHGDFQCPDVPQSVMR
jgi:hypothetical protein